MPGLRVWQLEALHEDGSAEWSFDMNKYFLPVPSTDTLVQMRQQRADMRRTVSRGLVVLAQDCEALLRGTLFAQNEQQFKANWSRALRKFDERIEDLGEEGASFLFDQVSACGNCHAVCRKMENLIKTYFALEGNRDIPEEGEEEGEGEREGEGDQAKDDLPLMDMGLAEEKEELHVTEDGRFNKPLHRAGDRLHR